MSTRAYQTRALFCVQAASRQHEMRPLPATDWPALEGPRRRPRAENRLNRRMMEGRGVYETAGALLVALAMLIGGGL